MHANIGPRGTHCEKNRWERQREAIEQRACRSDQEKENTPAVKWSCPESSARPNTSSDVYEPRLPISFWGELLAPLLFVELYWKSVINGCVVGGGRRAPSQPLVELFGGRHRQQVLQREDGNKEAHFTIAIVLFESELLSPAAAQFTTATHFC